MSDLISRQDAIKACFDTRCASIYDISDLIEMLPSAQRWIPRKERLPGQGQRILTTIYLPFKGRRVRSGTFYDGFFMNDNGDTWNATDMEVQAWMPLPEPYMRGEGE